MNTITINDIKIEIKNENCIYITKDDWVICLDDSIIGEKILTHWIDDKALINCVNSVIEY